MRILTLLKRLFSRRVKPAPELLTNDEAAALGGLAVVVRASAEQPDPGLVVLVSLVLFSRESCNEVIRGITCADLPEIIRCTNDPAEAMRLLRRARPDLELPTDVSTAATAGRAFSAPAALCWECGIANADHLPSVSGICETRGDRS